MMLLLTSRQAYKTVAEVFANSTFVEIFTLNSDQGFLGRPDCGQDRLVPVCCAFEAFGITAAVPSKTLQLDVR
jgi:hypothetical protein